MTTDDAATSTATRRGGGAWSRWRVGVLVGGAVMVLALAGAGVSWTQQADLRDLTALQQADAVVLDMDHHRYLADEVDLRYTVDGREVTASVPTSESWEDGRTVQVAHVVDDPTRVRLVDGWDPPWHQWLLAAVVAPLVTLLGGLRRGTTEGARRVGESPRRRGRGA